MRAAVVVALLLSCGLPEPVEALREERYAGAPCDCRTVGKPEAIRGALQCRTNAGVVALWNQGIPEACYPNEHYPCCAWEPYP